MIKLRWLSLFTSLIALFFSLRAVEKDVFSTTLPTNREDFLPYNLNAAKVDRIVTVSAVVTCKPLELILKSIYSFLANQNTFFIKEFFILFDCDNETIHSIISSMSISGHFLHIPLVPVMPTSVKKKHNVRALDHQRQLLNLVKTPYWFSFSDDWAFTQPGMLNNAMEILEKEPNIWMVLGHKAHLFRPFLNMTRGLSVTPSGVGYGVLYHLRRKSAHGLHGSYTMDPALLRTEAAKEKINVVGSKATDASELSGVLAKQKPESSLIAAFSKQSYYGPLERLHDKIDMTTGSFINFTKHINTTEGFPPVTGTMVSCNRLDLMQRSLHSFMLHNTVPLADFIVLLDCYNETVHKAIASENFGMPLTIIRSKSTSTNNEIRALDNERQLLSMVRTRFWFSTEDDWEFLRPGYLEESMDILKHEPGIWMVMGRKSDSFRPFMNASWGTQKTQSGLEYGVQRQQSGHGSAWHSYTANPTLTETSVAWEKMNVVGWEARYEMELSYLLGYQYMETSYIGIFVDAEFYRHIGVGGRSVMGHEYPLLKYRTKFQNRTR